MGDVGAGVFHCGQDGLPKPLAAALPARPEPSGDRIEDPRQVRRPGPDNDDEDDAEKQQARGGPRLRAATC